MIKRSIAKRFPAAERVRNARRYMIVASGISALLVGCAASPNSGSSNSGSSNSQSSLQLGETFPTSGAFGGTFTVSIQGIKLGLSHYASKLQSDGWTPPKSVNNVDTQGLAAPGTAALRQSIGAGNKFVITALTPVILAQAPVARRSNTLLLNSVAQDPGFSSIPNLLSSIRTIGSEAQLEGKYVASVLHYKSCGVLAPTDAYGSGAQNSFISGFHAGGGTKAAPVLPISYTQTNFSTEASKIVASGDKCVYLIQRTYPFFADMVRALRSAGFTGQIVADSSFVNAVNLSQAEKDFPGVIYGWIYGPPKDYAAFQKMWQNAFHTPLADPLAAPSYALVQLLTDTLAHVKPGSNWQAIVAAWKKLGTVQTVLGPTTTVGNGVTYPLALYKMTSSGEKVIVPNCTAQSCS